MEAGCRSESGSVGRYKNGPRILWGPYLLSVTQASRLFSTSAYITWRRVTQDPAGYFGGPRSEPPLPEDTCDYYSMRLSGSPPFACLPTPQGYYRDCIQQG